MKYLKKIIPAVFLLMMNCTAQEKAKQYDEITYVAQTRGSLINIKLLNDELSFKSNSKEGDFKLSKEEFSTLSNIIKKLDKESINSLKAPSERRITDGALHADFTIKVADKEYKSITFDAGNAPKELKELEDLLYKLCKLNE